MEEKIRIYAAVEYETTFGLISLNPIKTDNDDNCFYRDVPRNGIWNIYAEWNEDLNDDCWHPYEGTFYCYTYDDDGDNEVEWECIYKEGKLISRTRT